MIQPQLKLKLNSFTVNQEEDARQKDFLSIKDHEERKLEQVSTLLLIPLVFVLLDDKSAKHLVVS